MKQSIVGRLVGASVLVVVTVALLAVCFGAGLAADRAVEQDQRAFAGAGARVSAIAASMELLSQGAGSASSEERSRQIGAAAGEVDRLLNDAVYTTGSSILYPAKLKDSARNLQALVRSRWDAALQNALESVASPGGPGGGAGNSSSAAGPQALSQFFLITEPVLAGFSDLAGQLDAANDTTGRTLSVLFISFAALGTLALFGFILWAFLSFRRDIRMLTSFCRSLSAGNAAPILAVTDEGEIGELAAELRKVEARESLALQLRAASEKVVAGFPRAAENAAEIQESFTGQTRIVKDTTHGLADVTETVRNVARSAAASLEAAREGGNAVETSLQTIQGAIDAAKLLEERASRIEEVVALIGDVAEQTELLSLNAAIEAARAGEAGRGFTVVAQQVRKLADRSARSVSEVADLALVVLDSVRRIAADAKSSFKTIETLRRGLQGMSEGLASISGLADSAVDGAGRMESALARALELGSKTDRRAQAIAEVNVSLSAQVEQVAAIISQLTAGGAQGGQLVTRGQIGAGPGDEGMADELAGQDAAEARDAADASIASGGSDSLADVDPRAPLPDQVQMVDAIEELPPAEEEPSGEESSAEEVSLEELEPVDEDPSGTT
jgi:methyl-accepting chemotaxis protein